MSPSSRGDDKLIAVGGIPRADLLPPELKTEVTLRAQRRFMGLIVILAVALVVAGYLYAAVQAAANGLRLEASNASTVALTEQKAQYVEVTEVQSQIAKIKAAQIVAVSTEINWKKYLQLVEVALPAGTVVYTVNAETAAPGATIEAPSEPLTVASIASMSFVVISPTLPNVSDLIENLSKIPGFAYAGVSTISLREEDGRYEMTMEIHLNEEALENRFIVSDDDEATNEDDESAEETTP